MKLLQNPPHKVTMFGLLQPGDAFLFVPDGMLYVRIPQAGEPEKRGSFNAVNLATGFHANFKEVSEVLPKPDAKVVY